MIRNGGDRKVTALLRIDVIEVIDRSTNQLRAFGGSGLEDLLV